MTSRDPHRSAAPGDGSLAHLVFLLVPAVAIFVLFVLHKFQVARPEILDPHRSIATTDRLRLYALLLSAAFVLFCGALQIARHVPWRTFLPIALLLFAGTAIVATLTLPTRSQDVYWNLLLAKGWTERGLNPYTTPPARLEDDPWSGTVEAWRRLPMTHGPLWVLFLGSVTALHLPLLMSLRLVKGAALVALAGSGLLVWKILGVRGFAPDRKAALIASLALNPFVIQTVLIDAHNDVYVMLSILGSHLLLLRRKPAESALCLIAGGFVKFVPWLLLPFPLLQLLRSRGARRGLAQILGLLLAGAALGAVLYAPFGFSPEVFTGLRSELTERGWSGFYWPGSVLLAHAFSLGPAGLRAAGMVAGLIALSVAVVLDRPSWGYTVPYALILFFGTAAFHPWHALWLFPLLALSIPPVVSASLSLPLIVSELEPVPAQWAAVAALLAIVSMFHLAGRSRGADERPSADASEPPPSTPAPSHPEPPEPWQPGRPG
jgi:hypothetical protein